MIDFEFNNPSSRNLVRKSINEIASDIQNKYQTYTSKRYFLVVNSFLVEECINMAAISIKLHDTTSIITNEKKWAHISYWLLKWCPISYVISLPKSLPMRGRLRPSSEIIQINTNGKGHLSVNTMTAFYLFVQLYCSSYFIDEDAKTMFNKIYGSTNSMEILESFRKHNYSARSMAMFLETLMKDKII